MFKQEVIMKKFIESEREKIKDVITQNALSSENVLRQIQNFIQSLISEISAKDGPESVEHAVKGLLAIDEFVKKNVDLSVLMKDRVQFLDTLLEDYERKKDLLKKVEEKELSENKIRKISEKPIGVRQSRNLKNEADLYIEEDLPEEDS